MIDPLTLFLLFIFWPRPGGGRKPRQLASGMVVFPVSIDAASFSDDYSARHQGIDIFAVEGTAVLAPEAGALRFSTDPKGGNVFYLGGLSGTNYYGAHLMGYVGGDREVNAGEQIGFVGTSGNAKGGPAHLHFQMNGGGTNPFPTLKKLAPGAPAAPWARKRKKKEEAAA
jgi:murein DD-endopeptidase MepM/ murein hydrolase activator NlpD